MLITTPKIHYEMTMTMLKNLEMSETHVYMVRPNHLCKDYPLKPPKIAFAQCVTFDMQKYDIMIFLQMRPKHLEKTHAISLNTCNINMKGHNRHRNLGVGQNFGWCCSNENTSLGALVLTHYTHSIIFNNMAQIIWCKLLVC